MGWLDLDPATIRHILITHQDTDHVGALERDSELLFKDATVYIWEIENRYLTGEVRRKRAEICKPFTKKYTDPSAPFDGYIEDDDTEERARSVLLGKVAVNRQ